MAQPIHQEVVFDSKPDRIYKALTDAGQFSEFTGGAAAEIDAVAGGAFTCFGGMISGWNLELIPDRRVVQAWRVGNWGDGVYSIVRFELQGQGARTRLIFDHTGFPEGAREHLEDGWHKMYWEPLKQYLS